MTSTLLIVLVDREGSHWILSTLPFIWRLWPHPIQWEWENVGVTYKLLGGLGISIDPFSTETGIIFVLLPL